MDEIFYGDAVKALGDGKVAGYLVRFTGPDEKDTTGEYFTAETYLGAHDGNGSDCLFHHSLPIKGIPTDLTDHLFTPLKTRRDEVGLWAETVLNMADEYEAKVYELAKRGKLGWSSGAPMHMVRKSDDGRIIRWPISEGSLTPTPADVVNRALPLKVWQEQSALEDVAADLNELSPFAGKTTSRPGTGRTLAEHSQTVVSALSEYVERVEDRAAFRLATETQGTKVGRILSGANVAELEAVLGTRDTLSQMFARIEALLEKARPKTDDTADSASLRTPTADAEAARRETEQLRTQTLRLQTRIPITGVTA